MHILITGSTGLIGGRLKKRLTAAGHDVTPLVREERTENVPWWDPETGSIDLSPGPDLDAVIHLAGENIASGRWTEKRKKRIRDSRINGTRLLASALAALPSPPGLFLQAAAIGFYGDRGDEILEERSGPGDGFLAETCVAWEEAGGAAREAGIRTVPMRIGVVLDSAGGALEKMLRPFRLGIGGPVGSGRQYVSWISLEDLTAAVEFLLRDRSISGPVNLVSPGPVPQRALARALGKAVHRPAFLPMPALAVKLVFGEMGQDLLLASTRVMPSRLLEAGFEFKDPEIYAALQRMLG